MFVSSLALEEGRLLRRGVAVDPGGPRSLRVAFPWWGYDGGGRMGGMGGSPSLHIYIYICTYT